MDAFEHLVAAALSAQGYWTRTCYKVDLSREDKYAIGRHSSPRWEVDVIGYMPMRNEVLAVECKSYLDSHGVKRRDFKDLESPSKSRYKLFNEVVVRDVVLRNLGEQLHQEGLALAEPTVKLALAVGSFASPKDRDGLTELFEERGWLLFDDHWIKARLIELAETKYSNNVEAVVAKLLLRA